MSKEASLSIAQSLMGLLRRKSTNSVSKQEDPIESSPKSMNSNGTVNGNLFTSKETSPIVGMEHWQEVRKKWTGNPTIQSQQNDSFDLDEENLLQVYNGMVKDQRKFSKSMPMGFVVKSLVVGWKQEGIYHSGAENWD